MTLWQLTGAAILLAVIIAAMRDSGCRTTPYILAAGGTLFLVAVLSRLATPLGALASLLGESPLSSYASVLLRGLGIVWVTKIGGEICRDLGAESVAGRLELCGRAELLLLTLPYVTELVKLAVRLVEEGV